MPKKYLLIIVIILLCFIYLKKEINFNYKNNLILGDTSSMLGDVNGDGRVSSSDYILIRKHILGQSLLSNSQKAKADVNSDNKISASDYLLVKKMIINGTNISSNNQSTNWNQYTVTYTSSVPLKGTITYSSSKNSNSIETFLLEPATNGTFTSFINYWIEGNMATNMKSITLRDLNGNEVNALKNIELKKGSTADELLSKHFYQTNNDYYSKTVFIGNNYLTLGISLDWGGSVTYLSGTTNTYSGGIVGENVINSADDGREIQDAFYGNKRFKGQLFGHSGGIEAYNPVQGGYTVGGISHGSKLVDISIDDNLDTITIISRPLLWELDNNNYINQYKDEYSGRVTDSYIYQTYHLNKNTVELTHSYIDFTDNYSEYLGCSSSGYGNCSHAEAPVIYTIGGLKKLKFCSDNTIDNKNLGETFWSKCAGLYNSSDQGIGIFIKNYNPGNTYFVNTPYGDLHDTATSKEDTTNILYTIVHFDLVKAKKVTLPDVTIVLGTPNDLKNVSN